MDIREAVQSLGDCAQKQQLVRLGATDRALTRAVKCGAVIRVRNGWYATLPAFDAAMRAVRVGGRLTGLSAIAYMGGWVLASTTLHVAIPQNAARLRSPHNRRQRFDPRRPESVALHWEPREQQDSGSSTVVALLDALVRVVLDEKLEDAIAALDWALHFNLIDERDLAQITSRVPQNLRWISGWTDAACESLPESLGRTRMRLSGRRVRSQVDMHSGERIDLVVDECVAMEIDGRQFHLDKFEQDRRKDIRITIEHLHALRPTARMVFDDWASVALATEIALRERGHPPALPVGNSGLGRFGPLRRSTFVRKRRAGPHRSPEFPTRVPDSGGG